jgi:exodeoxyribonuclease VII small subunit
MTTSSPQTYEELYTRMQQIVAQLESGELPLADAMALYEEGVKVAAACQAILDRAELRVQELLVGGADSSHSFEE